MARWSVGPLTPKLSNGAGSLALGGMAALGMAGSMLGSGVNIALQNIQAFGFWAAATGSRLGMTGLDFGGVGKGALIGAGMGLAAGLAVFGAETLKSWRSARAAQSSFDKTAQGPRLG